MTSMPIWAQSLEKRSETEPGYPCMAYEEWFQQGMECFTWALPRSMVRQALEALAKRWRDAGKRVEGWHLRAFVYGLRGGRDPEARPTIAGYIWPVPVDSRWELVAVVYRDGHADLDWLHAETAAFWSEEHGFLDLPPHQGQLRGKDWFERMGISVLVE